MSKIPWFNEKATDENKCRNLILAMALFDDGVGGNDLEVTLEAATYLVEKGQKFQQYFFPKLTEYLPLEYSGEKIFHLQKYQDILRYASSFIEDHSS